MHKSRLAGLIIDCQTPDVDAAATFWTQALGYKVRPSAHPEDVGYRVLDTRMFADGLHTLSWIVTDDAGVTEGLGSRYFTVANGAVTSNAAREASSRTESRWLASCRRILEPCGTRRFRSISVSILLRTCVGVSEVIQSFAVTFHSTGVRPRDRAVFRTSGRRAPKGGRKIFGVTPVVSAITCWHSSSSWRTFFGAMRARFGCVCV